MTICKFFNFRYGHVTNFWHHSGAYISVKCLVRLAKGTPSESRRSVLLSVLFVCNGLALFVGLFVCGTVTMITRNCIFRSSPNWVLSLPLPSFPLPLEVGPLNPARGLGERCKLPSGVWGRAPQLKSNLVHFSFKI